MVRKKKKRRKSRFPQQAEQPETQEDRDKVQYQDEFQRDFGGKLEEFASKLEGKGKNILYGIIAFAVLGIAIVAYVSYNKSTNNQAQAALGSAIETSQSEVNDAPLPAGSTQKRFKTGKARAEAAIAEFQEVADKYGSPYSEKAKYFIAVNKLTFDRETAITELEELSAANDDTGVLSKFALAQAKTGDKKLDEAAKLYKELTELGNPVLAKETINYELAKIYQKQEKDEEAANLYLDIVNKANEAKDAEGNPVPLGPTASDAKLRLETISPEKAKEIKEPESKSDDSEENEGDKGNG